MGLCENISTWKQMRYFYFMMSILECYHSQILVTTDNKGKGCSRQTSETVKHTYLYCDKLRKVTFTIWRLFVFYKTIAIWLLYQIYIIMWNSLKRICTETVVKLILTRKDGNQLCIAIWGCLFCQSFSVLQLQYEDVQDEVGLTISKNGQLW